MKVLFVEGDNTQPLSLKKTLSEARHELRGPYDRDWRTSLLEPLPLPSDLHNCIDFSGGAHATSN